MYVSKIHGCIKLCVKYVGVYKLCDGTDRKVCMKDVLQVIGGREMAVNGEKK